MPEVETFFKAPKKATKRKPKSLKDQATEAWSRYVRARDGKCLVCGRVDGKRDAHHVMIRSHNATRTDETNGVTVCYQCHALLHSDPLKAVYFYSNHYGIQGYADLRRKAYEGKGRKYPASFWKSELERLQKLTEAL